MEIDEINQITNEIIENTLEFISAEFILNFKTKLLDQSKLLSISSIIFSKMLINSVMNTSDILEADPLKIYDSLEIRNKIKMIIEKKNES